VEIDKFRDFQAQYAEKDQVLLRFVMVNVLEELAQMHRLEVWVDWLTASQMAALVQADAEDGAAVREMLEQLRRWVETNLAFTLTIAIGEPVADINEAVLSRDGAEQALRRKSTLGINRILMPEPGAKKPEPPVYEQLQDIRELAERFRSGDDRWEERFAELAAHIRRSDCERAEIVNLVQYLQYQLSKEIRSLPEAYSEMWNRQTLPAIEAGLESFETFDELEAELHTRLKELYDHIEALRESNSVYATIRQVREYIETHYHDSSLSLVQLGDQFNLSPTYLSRLFKEEMGEKLIDCIAKIRMEHAKRLLLAGELPVQDIAERVGYVHAFSFIRAFKKLVGKTPGDYRKEGG
jgi:YesN/AraC family two-component response regulator